MVKRRQVGPGTVVLLGVASFIAVCALAAAAVAFSTDHWIEYRVKDLTIPVGQEANEIYYNRDRGLIRTCFNSDDALTFLILNNDDVTDIKCLYEQGYELDGESEDWGGNYDKRTHLMRAHVMLLILGILLMLFSCVLAILVCYALSVILIRWTAAVLLLAGLLVAIGMAMFHILQDMEESSLDDGGPFPAGWPDDVDDATTWRYGYSYMVCWVSVGLAIISCILYIIAQNLMHRQSDDQKHLLYEENTLRSYRGGYIPDEFSIMPPPKPYMTYMPPQSVMPVSTEPLEPLALAEPSMIAQPYPTRMIPVPPPVFVPDIHRPQMMPQPMAMTVPVPVHMVPYPVSSYGGYVEMDDDDPYDDHQRMYNHHGY